MTILASARSCLGERGDVQDASAARAARVRCFPRLTPRQKLTPENVARAHQKTGDRDLRKLLVAGPA